MLTNFLYMLYNMIYENMEMIIDMKKDSGMDNGIYAVRDDINNIQSYFNSILLGDPEEGDLEENEANYFAMCLLMPEKELLKAIEIIGGFEEVKKDINIAVLAKCFNVPNNVMLTRIKQVKENAIRNERNNSTQLRAKNLKDSFKVEDRTNDSGVKLKGE